MSRRGFTLLEMMVAGALLSVVLAIGGLALVGLNGASERVRRVGDTQETARQALDAIADEIRNAGASMSNGQVGVAWAAGNARRIPVIYSGPDVVVTSPGGATMVTNSIYLVSIEPGTGVPSSDGTFMLGVVASANVGAGATSLQVLCVNNKGVAVDCGDTATFGAQALIPSTLPPLVVGDYRTAVYMRPTALSGPSSGTQKLQFAEGTAGAYSPDPKAPFGFAPGAAIGRARVTHYYLQFNSIDNAWELKRSHPILNSTPLGMACAAGDNPFIDETNDSVNGPAGVFIGSGPIESLQFRYVVDTSATDDPTQFTIWRAADAAPNQNHITVCDTSTLTALREIRVQIVGRSPTRDLSTGAGGVVLRYSTPGYEGASPSSTVSDAYPRRTFEARIVPRNLQGIIRL